MAQTASATTVEHSFRLSVSIDFDFAVLDVDGKHRTELENMPWPGDWVFEMRRESAKHISVGLSSTSATRLPCPSERTTISLTFFWIGSDGVAHPFPKANGLVLQGVYRQVYDEDASEYSAGVHVRLSQHFWTRAASAGGYDPAAHRSYRFTATFEEEDPKTDAWSRTPAEELASRVTGPFCLAFLHRA